MDSANEEEGGLLERVLAAMTGLIETGEADVVQSEDGREIGIFGDVWTVHLEEIGGALTAFAVIDDEPDDPAEIPQIRAAVFDADITSALTALDTRLDGALVRALVASGDPLSVDLAQVLAP